MTKPPKNSVPGCPAETLPRPAVWPAAGLDELRRQVRAQQAELAHQRARGDAAVLAAVRAEQREAEMRDEVPSAERALQRARGQLCQACGGAVEDDEKEAA